MSSPRGPRDPRHERLEQLLRGAASDTDSLLAPDGSWERISRRAHRRKFVKATMGVAAGVIVAAGAVPAVIAVRHNNQNDDASVQIANNSPGPNVTGTSLPAPIPTTGPGSLAGFFPASASFVSATRGFLWGSIGSSANGVMAETQNDGQSWVKIPAPPVRDAFVSQHGGDGQVRFSTDGVGFVFGSSYWMSPNFGETWTKLASPGYIDSLETRGGHIWALVRPSQQSQSISLYEATTALPTLQPVSAVSTLRGAPPRTSTVASTASIAVSGTTDPNVNRVVVIGGSSGFWLSPNGRHWTQGVDPCQAGPHGAAVRSSLLSISGARDVVAACGYNVRGSNETKVLYTSSNSGRSWKRTKSQPPAMGFLNTLAAGTSSHAMLGTNRGGAQITTDTGQTWANEAPDGYALSFVGYIDLAHIVAISNREGSDLGGAFATSTNGGQSWSVTPFPAQTQ